MLAKIDRDVATCLQKLQKATGSEVNGEQKAERVQIGTKQYNAFIEDIPSDLQLMSGGEVQTAKFSVWISKADMPQEPAENIPVKVRGKELATMNPIVDKRSFWSISVGDYSE